MEYPILVPAEPGTTGRRWIYRPADESLVIDANSNVIGGVALGMLVGDFVHVTDTVTGIVTSYSVVTLNATTGAAGLRRVEQPPVANRAEGYVNTYAARITAGLGTLPDSHKTILKDALNVYMRSSGFPKIKALWAPMGATLTDATAWLIKPATADTLTVAGAVTTLMTYSASGGITPGTQYLSSGVSPNTAGLGLSANNWGYAAYALGPWTIGTIAGYDTSYIAAQGDNFTSNISGKQVRGASTKGLGLIQVRNGVAESYQNGSLIASDTVTTPSLSANVLHFAASGGVAIPNTSLGGGAIFTALTKAEVADLAIFFSQVNKNLLRISTRDVLRLGVAGDSIGVGTGVSGAGISFASRLATRLGLTLNNVSSGGRAVTNAGPASTNYLTYDSGSTAFGNLPIWRGVLPNANSEALMVIELGLNDLLSGASVSSFSAGFDSIIASYLETDQSVKSMVLCSPPRPAAATDYATALLYADAVQSLAAKYGCGFADLTRGRLIGSNAFTGSDGVHPLDDATHNGHELIMLDIFDAFLALK